MRRAAAGTLAVAVVAAGAGGWALASGSGGAEPAAATSVPLGSATVERRDLVERQDVSATLGFSRARSISAPAQGTLTRLRPEGSTVTRGLSLMSVDAEATAWVLYGTRPMYRDLGPGADDGGDIRQLERNLAALGYDPGTVDAEWTSSTTDAVTDFQEDRGLDETGSLSREEIVVSDGPLRVGAHDAEVGDAVGPGKAVTEVSSTTPVVTADVEPGLAGSLRRGDPVVVTLPDGRTANGRVTRVGTVASAASPEDSPTIELRAALDGKRRSRLDGAPVTLSLETDATEGALAVPVTALVATAPSEYAIELQDSHELVPVRLGAFADGWAEVSGEGIAEGVRVVVPA